MSTPDAPEKLRRTMQAFPSLTLPEAIQFLGQLHDAGLDVGVRTPADSVPRYTPCPKCNDEQVVCTLDGEILGPCDCTDLPVGDAATRARALIDAATPGPWQADANLADDMIVYRPWGDNSFDPIAVVDSDKPAADAALIAAAPTLITDLLAEVDELAAAVDRNARMATEYAGKAVEYKQEREAAEAERDAAVARADRLRWAIREHHEAIWSEWSQTSRSIPPPADVALWAHVDIDPAARFAAERDRGTDR